jgi:hypothetical protein
MFVKRLNESEERALYETAAAGAALLDEIGLPWWLSNGTLLGSWRHHGIIPWDDDLDIAFPREHVDILKQAALDRGWGYARLAPFLAKIWDPKVAVHHPKVSWTWPFIDIALYDEVPMYKLIVVEYGYHQHYKAFSVSDILPTQPYHFGPRMLPIPHKPELMLDTLYSSWKTQPLSGYHCHRQERAYAEPPVRASIAKLAEQFTFFNVPGIASSAAITLSVMDQSWLGWVKDNLSRGCDPEGILSVLLKQKFPLSDIRQSMGVKFPEQSPQLQAVLGPKA